MRILYVQTCNNVLSVLELLSRYYLHIGTNTIGKGMNLVIQQWVEYYHFCNDGFDIK